LTEPTPQPDDRHVAATLAADAGRAGHRPIGRQARPRRGASDTWERGRRSRLLPGLGHTYKCPGVDHERALVIDVSARRGVRKEVLLRPSRSSSEPAAGYAGGVRG
jgi:hypothetical protein